MLIDVHLYRLEAMRALGLYCLLEGIPRPEGQIAALRAGLVWHSQPAEAGAAAEEAAVRMVAAKALCDWAVIRCVPLPSSCCCDAWPADLDPLNHVSTDAWCCSHCDTHNNCIVG